MNFNCNWHKNLVFSCGELGVTIDNTRTGGWIVTKDEPEHSQVSYNFLKACWVAYNIILVYSCIKLKS